MSKYICPLRITPKVTFARVMRWSYTFCRLVVYRRRLLDLDWMSAYFFLCSFLNQFHFTLVFIVYFICSKLNFCYYSYVVTASEFWCISPSGISVRCSPLVPVMPTCGNHTGIMARRALLLPWKMDVSVVIPFPSENGNIGCSQNM
jgi:hypothetical protein